MKESKYNKITKRNTVLEKGEEFCPKCGGYGTVPISRDRSNLSRSVKNTLTCDRCFGEGKLDWIEMAMGKRYQSIEDFLMKIWSQKIAQDVDKEIMSSLMQTLEEDDV